MHVSKDKGMCQSLLLRELKLSCFKPVVRPVHPQWDTAQLDVGVEDRVAKHLIETPARVVLHERLHVLAPSVGEGFDGVELRAVVRRARYVDGTVV
eukprot:1354851-Amorphochlora_amoeboformis.AAC.2